jgi:hypothetical protein
VLERGRVAFLQSYSKSPFCQNVGNYLPPGEVKQGKSPAGSVLISLIYLADSYKHRTCHTAVFPITSNFSYKFYIPQRSLEGNTTLNEARPVPRTFFNYRLLYLRLQTLSKSVFMTRSEKKSVLWLRFQNLISIIQISSSKTLIKLIIF